MNEYYQEDYSYEEDFEESNEVGDAHFAQNTEKSEEIKEIHKLVTNKHIIIISWS